MNKANILVTGGLGYIGSHTSVELINNSYNVTIIDSLINSEKFILERIEKIIASTTRGYTTYLERKRIS